MFKSPWLARSFLILFIPLGIWACLDVGMAWDDFYEQHTFAINYLVAHDLIEGSQNAYNALITHHDRYYGMGFHAPAYLIAHLLESLVNQAPSLGPGNNPLDLELFLNIITLKHIAVFLCFVLSGYLVKRITQSITASTALGAGAMISFLLWPYLLGHSLMNIKDMPFAFAWLLATFWALRLFDRVTNNQSYEISPTPLSTKDYVILALISAWLVSIRISGILILIEYGILACFAFYQFKSQSRFQCQSHQVQGHQITRKTLLQNMGLFFGVFFLAVYLLYPLFWLNPIEFFNAIAYQTHNPIGIDTYTAGELISNRAVGLRYLLTWFLVKLPIIVLAGLALTPLLFISQIQKRCSAQNVAFQQGYIKIILLLCTVLAILLLLRLRQVHLYNELRHLLFLFPLLFIAAVSTLYFLSKSICAVLLILSSLIFAIDNIKLYPYQYTYLNEFTRLMPISEHFEKDYFALSASKTAKWLNTQSIKDVQCIFASPLHSWLAYIDQKAFPCNEDLPKNGLQNAKRPFLLYGQIRDPKTPAPLQSCHLLHEQKRSLFGSAYTFVMSRLYLCQ